MTPRERDDDTDARFRDIMGVEFGEPRPFNLTESLDEAVPDEPDEPFVPPQPSVEAPQGVWLVCSLLLGFAVVVALMGLFGLAPHTTKTLGPWAVASFVAGLVVFLRNLPKEPRDPYDDGARV